MKPVFLLAYPLLLTVAGPVPAQDNRSMYEAWTKGDRQFESLSSDYGYDEYGYDSEPQSSGTGTYPSERSGFNSSQRRGRDADDTQRREILPDQSEQELR